MKREGLKDRIIRYNLQNKNKAGRPKKEMKLVFISDIETTTKTFYARPSEPSAAYRTVS